MADLSDDQAEILALLGGSAPAASKAEPEPEEDLDETRAEIVGLLEAAGPPAPRAEVIERPNELARVPGRKGRSSSKIGRLIEEGTVEALELCLRVIRGEEKVVVATREGHLLEVDVDMKERIRAAELITKFGFKAHEAQAQAQRDALKKQKTEAELRQKEVQTFKTLLQAAQAKRKT